MFVAIATMIHGCVDGELFKITKIVLILSALVADSAAALSHVHRKLEKAYQHECMSYERVKKIY